MFVHLYVFDWFVEPLDWPFVCSWTAFLSAITFISQLQIGWAVSIYALWPLWGAWEGHTYFKICVRILFFILFYRKWLLQQYSRRLFHKKSTSDTHFSGCHELRTIIGCVTVFQSLIWLPRARDTYLPGFFYIWFSYVIKECHF